MGQGDYFRGRVHGSGMGSSEVRVQAGDVFEMGRGEGQAVTESGSGSGSGSGSASGSASRGVEEDTETQASSESQRGIVGGKRGVVVTREFSVR